MKEDKDEIEYHKYLNRLCIIKNSINLVCLTILAILFKKWWIVLLALLFNVSIQEIRRTSNDK